MNNVWKETPFLFFRGEIEVRLANKRAWADISSSVPAQMFSYLFVWQEKGVFLN